MGSKNWTKKIMNCAVIVCGMWPEAACGNHRTNYRTARPATVPNVESWKVPSIYKACCRAARQAARIQYSKEYSFPHVVQSIIIKDAV